MNKKRTQGGFTPYMKRFGCKIKNAAKKKFGAPQASAGSTGFTPYISTGFTLIELLVVISIIGLLSSFTAVALNDSRIKARDAKRKFDLAALGRALDLYYDDFSHYPISNDCGNPRTVEPGDLLPEVGIMDVFAYSSDPENPLPDNYLIDMLVKRRYLEDYVYDPLDSDLSEKLYRYYSTADGEHFSLYTVLEGPSEEDSKTLNIAPPNNSECLAGGNYRVIR